MSKCPTCGKTVFFAERVQAIGKDFHKICLKCVACEKKLEPGNFSDRDGHLFCKGCYSKTKGGAIGFGFWSGASGVAGIYDLEHPVTVVPDKRACAKCGVTVAEDSQFCPECGNRYVDAPKAREPAAPTSKDLTCSSCHAPYLPGAKFCGGCGNQL